MVPEEYRVINRAICLLTDENQDEREMARTALHVLFRQQCRLEQRAQGRYTVSEQAKVSL